MKAFLLCLVAAVAVVKGEPPVSGGYSYSRPGGHGGGGHGGGSFGGGTLVPVAPGPNTNEGQYVDGQILEEVRKIILKDEAASSSLHGGGGGGGYAPSSSYGVPSSGYGVPSSSYGVPSTQYISRVVGVDLEGVKQALQVAQYEQSSGGGGGGYSYSAPSYTSYSVPSSGYGAPSRPSGSYGVPF
ncbi:pro-resilin [Halyomorpha halys]|uniref:pro-resilin n=1 Tax=Halyomorpha halys TaxID=286706 RepID=UPI0006D5288C|nr:pro-resilin [Halyomorpha halys]